MTAVSGRRSGRRDERRVRVASLAYTHFASDPRVKREARVFAEAGFDVDVFALEAERSVAPGDPRITHHGIPIRRYRGARAGSYLASYASFLLRTAMRLEARHLLSPYDLVHAHTMPDMIVLSSLWLKAGGVPVLLDVHDQMPEIYSEKFGVGEEDWRIRFLYLTERMCCGLADRVITPTVTQAKRLASNGVPEAKIVVVHNLPDPAVFGSPGASLGREDRSVFRIVYHGTLARRLGLDIALRALAGVRGEMDALGPWRFEIFGDGDARRDLVEHTGSLGLEDRVRFSDGLVPVEELPGRLLGAALGVVPSRRQRDTDLMLPTKLLEYLYMGIPAVACSTRAVKDYFDGGQVSMLDDLDAASLGKEIVALRRDPARREETARRALTFFRSHRWEDEAGRLLGTAVSLLDPSRGTGAPAVSAEEP